MQPTLIRFVAAGLLLVGLAACSGNLPPAKAPTTDVNPITGSRGGTN